MLLMYLAKEYSFMSNNFTLNVFYCQYYFIDIFICSPRQLLLSPELNWQGLRSLPWQIRFGQKVLLPFAGKRVISSVLKE